MGAINDIFRKYGPEYIRRFPNMPGNHRKVINAMIDCRSGTLGQLFYLCGQCGQVHVFHRSCGNRHTSGCNRPRKMTLDAMEFIRRFLQHVLPTGFMKVRHYGFLSANCAVTIVKIRLLIVAALEVIFSLDDLLPPPGC